METHELKNSPQLPSYPQFFFMEALDELNPTEGANKTAISNFMESKYGEMPARHIDLLTTHLTQMKNSGELLFSKNNYLKPGPDVPVKRGRGRPPKAKKLMLTGMVVSPPRPRGRPRKNPDAPPASPAPKKQKPWGESLPSVSPRKPRASPRKGMPQPVHNGVEA